jgi:hypothetical protein
MGDKTQSFVISSTSKHAKLAQARAFVSRFRYFDIGNFQFRDSDINSDISNIQFDEENFYTVIKNFGFSLPKHSVLKNLPKHPIIQSKFRVKSTKHSSQSQYPRSLVFGEIYKFNTKLRDFHR